MRVKHIVDFNTLAREYTKAHENSFAKDDWENWIAAFRALAVDLREPVCFSAIGEQFSAPHFFDLFLQKAKTHLKVLGAGAKELPMEGNTSLETFSLWVYSIVVVQKQ